jgi:hypothetical protein
MVSALTAHADVVFDNTTTPTAGPVSYIYSAIGATQIGDQVQLGGTLRSLTSASVQFFNAGDAGTFDAVLRLYKVGAPVGSQIGTDFTRTGISIGSFADLQVTFATAGHLVPDNLIFTVEVRNASAGVDPGLDAFEPPTIGSSDNASLITYDGVNFSVGSTAVGEGNLYFSATAVPEPSSILLSGLGLGLTALIALRKRVR